MKKNNVIQKKETKPTIAIKNNNKAITPMEMISMAVQRGDLEKLEKLMELQERWEKNEASKAYVIAIGNVKSSLPKIIKSKNVSFPTKNGETNYDYAPLNKIMPVIDPILSKNNMFCQWKTDTSDPQRITVTCILKHELGGQEETTLSGPPDITGGKNSIQAIGSTVSYLQRYTIAALLGLVAGEDNDANIPIETIDDNQREEIVCRIESIPGESRMEAFKKIFRVKNIGDIPAEKYEKALSIIDKVAIKEEEKK